MSKAAEAQIRARLTDLGMLDSEIEDIIKTQRKAAKKDRRA